MAIAHPYTGEHEAIKKTKVKRPKIYGSANVGETRAYTGTSLAYLLYSLLRKKLSEDRVREIISDAVGIETEFICHALLLCALVGMNGGLMSQYIEFMVDRLLGALGYRKMYNVENPFDWLELISLQGKTNFFEKRVREYLKASLMSSLSGNCGIHEFKLDEDF